MEDGLDSGDLLIYPDFDKLLEEHRWKWVDDALGLVPLCLMMLKGCHLMSERLAHQAMNSKDQKKFMELALVGYNFKKLFLNCEMYSVPLFFLL